MNLMYSDLNGMTYLTEPLALHGLKIYLKMMAKAKERVDKLRRLSFLYSSC